MKGNMRKPMMKKSKGMKKPMKPGADKDNKGRGKMMARLDGKEL